MARPFKPLVKGGGYYPSNRWTPLVYRGGYTTANGGGDQPDPVEKTVSGAIVHITDALAAPVVAMSVAIEPVQDLHGYDNPWPAGGGANKFGGEIVIGKRWQDDSYVTAATNNYAASDFKFPCSPNTEYRAILPDAAEIIALYCVEFDANGDYLRTKFAVSLTPSNNSKTFTTDEDAYMIACTFYCASDISPISVGRFAVNYPSSVTTYSPYSNICPISGWDAAKVWVQPTHDTSANPTATIQIGQTVYGGTLDVTQGKMVVDRANIASYSGETLPGKWISDRDVYSAGTTPTTGAQVVYELATTIEITLTPTQISALQGASTVWSDAGDVTVTYLADGNASDAEALGILLGGRYTPSDDVTDKEALGIILGGTE